MLWLGDERWVPPDHPDSNAGMARRAFVDEVGAATGGARLLARRSPPGGRRLCGCGSPRPADAGLILLGMGDDGHTASLFPGTDALDVTDRSYVANWVAAKDDWRLTATLPLLWSAQRTVFLVTGDAKAELWPMSSPGGATIRPAGSDAADATPCGCSTPLRLARLLVVGGPAPAAARRPRRCAPRRGRSRRSGSSDS